MAITGHCAEQHAPLLANREAAVESSSPSPFCFGGESESSSGRRSRLCDRTGFGGGAAPKTLPRQAAAALEEGGEMKVVALVSGGKDSCYAMMRCMDYGHEIVALANLLPLDDSVDELDSYMYQTVGHQIVTSYADCMGLPLFRRRIRGSSRHQHLNYKVTSGDEVEDMFILINEVKQQIPSVTAVSSGAIASDYQRLRVESVCSRLGLVSLAYLWKQDQAFLLEQMIQKEIKAITIKVAAMGLNPAEHLGRDIMDLQAHLLNLKERYGINVCGEGGEYETLTLDCPLFTNAWIVLDDFKIILHSVDSIAPVGILHPLAFHLEHKSIREEVGFHKICGVHEVGDHVPHYLVGCRSVDSVSDSHAAKKSNVHISRTKRSTFLIGSWIQNSSQTPEGVQEDLTSILERLELELGKSNFGWEHVLYIHLYIADMNEFALANEVYLKFITEKKCHLGVPSRSTIQLPLNQVGLGDAYVEVLVTDDQSKRVLHVQSISCWAPSCIGPYSQATLHKEILYMAGQLGLDPPTMMLCSGGPSAEMEQALENCEAVAKCFNCSIASSAVLLTIYCASSLSLSERLEIQQQKERFLRQATSASSNVGSSGAPDSMFLYVLAPDLPKRALVEVKPVLHISEAREAMFQDSAPESCSTKIPLHWDFEPPNLHDFCCQKYIVHQKICAVVVSITYDVATQICSGIDKKPSDSKYCIPREYMERISRFCIYHLNRTLLENNFSWSDLINLRFYFSTGLCMTADALGSIFHQIFSELAGASSSIEMASEPVFNLIPVMGSGRSAAMEDLITCELFASKM
ncbi:hypothetical protein Taro_034922 [Colocasia esculenta]|uniref:Diphthine--ammonia ligase n=1 Tax=Colocasia esculenta TaxID=4460 RepID=A0A843WH00_COLES|nr:hypothetical protein [Colocasia esculenta]